MVTSGGVNEAGWLLAVDGLVEVAMKKRILHVQLVNRPRAGGNNAKDDANRGWFDKRTEGLVVVNPEVLGEAADHPTRLVSSKGAVGVELVLEDPLARHDVGAWGSWDESQVPLSMRARNSLFMAARQFASTRPLR
jgi:hypothetical protein